MSNQWPIVFEAIQKARRELYALKTEAGASMQKLLLYRIAAWFDSDQDYLAGFQLLADICAWKDKGCPSRVYKFCPECQQTKRLDYFHANAKRVDNCDDYCRACRNAYRRDYYHNKQKVCHG